MIIDNGQMIGRENSEMYTMQVCVYIYIYNKMK